MSYNFTNNGSALLTVGVLAVDTAITVDTVATLPAVFPYILTITDGTLVEIVTVTSVATNTLTITRGSEGTTALAWAIGTLVSHRLTALPLNNFVSYNATSLRGFAIGDLSVLGTRGEVVLGQSAKSASGGRYNVCVGHSSSVTGGGRYMVSVGDSASTDYGSVAVGYSSSGLGYGVSIGYNAATQSGSVAVGDSAKATGTKGIAVGTSSSAGSGIGNVSIGSSARLAGANANTGAKSIMIGYRANAGDSYNVALGTLTKAYGNQSVALGANKVNNLAYSTMISNPITISKDIGSTTPARDFSGVETVIMTNELPLTAIGSQTVALPVGGIMLISSAGIFCSAATGVITTQPTIELSTSLDNITYTPLQAAAITTTLTGSRTFETLAIPTPTTGTLYLRMTVTVAGVSTLVYNARAFFKGIFIEE